MRGVADVAVALIVIVALARGGENAGTLVVVSVLALLYFAVRVATSGRDRRANRRRTRG